MSAVKSIMIVGVGGQGTLLASRILGRVLLDRGYDVKLSEVHGMSQRGGSVVTYVRFGEKVYSPMVEKGEADIVLSFEELESARWLPYLKKDGVLIVNDQRMDPMPVVMGAAKYPENIIEDLSKEYKVIAVDALSEAKKLGNAQVFNVVILGVAAKHMDFSVDQWNAVIERIVKPKFVEINKKAFEVGYNL